MFLSQKIYNFFMEKDKSIFTKYVIISIFILAAILRLAYFDTKLELHNDENVYHNSGDNLLKYGTLTNDRDGQINRGEANAIPTSTIQPGYPMYIAIIYTFLGTDVVKLRLLNIILSLLSMFMVYKISKSIGLKSNFIVLALLLMSFYPGFNYSIAKLLTEHLFTLLLLAHIYFFIEALNKNSKKMLLIASIFITLSIFVRAHGFPILLIGLAFIIMFEKKNVKEMLAKCLSVISVFILIMLPWWIRNYMHFNEFILFSDAGENPKLWGALPYFIGIFEVGNTSLQEIIKTSFNVNELLFIKWRIFGFIQYMWGDIWDEYLFHPFQSLRPFIILQYLVIVPTVIMIPLIILKSKKEVLYLTTIPLIFTIMNMPYHGLPRYVWPSIPIVIVLFAYLIQLLWNKEYKKYLTTNTFINNIQKLLQLAFRGVYFLFSILFSIVLIYSIFFFSFNIEKEMSEFRLNRYLNISTEKLVNNDKKLTEEFDIESPKLQIENVKINRTSKGTQYINTVTDHTLLRVKDISSINNSGSVISKVEIGTKGGYFYDYMTVYWKGDNDSDFSESKVYRFPTNFLEKKQIIYMDQDITELLIVPVNFRGGSFEFDCINVTKYEISN